VLAGTATDGAFGVIGMLNASAISAPALAGLSVA
jgi:hypothetical protein